MKNYLEGTKHIYDYYIGLVDSNPYCLLLTSYEDEETLDQYLPYILKDRKTHGLDFMVGNEAYLGKSLSHQTLQEFCLFLNRQDPLNTRFIIDPQANNPRAIRV